MSNKIACVADCEGRIVSRHMLVLISKNTKVYEDTNDSSECDINPDVNVKPSGK